MMLAAARKEMVKLKALVDAGGNVNETDASGWSVLMYAACSSSYSPVEMLLKAGADPNQSSPHGDTPLMVSCLNGNWDDNLVESGADVNAQNKVGQTALMMLAARDNVDEIRDALEAGSDASLKDKQGRTALDYLKLASCGKSPLYDPLLTNIGYGYSKCTAFPADELRAAEKLIEDTLHQKR